jgi:hypothetical protein
MITTMTSRKDLENYVSEHMGSLADENDVQLVSDFIHWMENRPAYGAGKSLWNAFLDRIDLWETHSKARKRESRYEN